MVVPVPLYAVEKLARLFFFPLSFLPFLPLRNGQKRAKGCWFPSNAGPRWGGCRKKRKNKGERAARERSLDRAFPFPSYPIDTSANEFCNPIKTFPSAVIKSLSQGYLDISRSGKTLDARQAIPRNGEENFLLIADYRKKESVLKSVRSGLRSAILR